MSHYLASFTVDLFRFSVWFVALMIVFVPLERLFGLHSQRVFRVFFLSDAAYYFINAVLPKLFLILPITALTAALHHFVPSAYYAQVAALPVWVRIAGAMLVGEIGSYWAHRWCHENPFLWQFHAIHHSAEEIDWLVSSKAHPIDLFFTRLCVYVPMYALGLAQPMGNSVDFVPALVTIIGTFWGFFIHANLNWRFGWFEWLIASPAFHHWHHTNDGPEVINKNYAPMLPWVDAVFGTFYLPSKEWPARYGTETQVAPTLTGQLLLQPTATGDQVVCE